VRTRTPKTTSQRKAISVLSALPSMLNSLLTQLLSLALAAALDALLGGGGEGGCSNSLEAVW
jgi:hypothetical protein